MTTSLRLFLVVAAASALGVAALASAPAPSDNVLEIVIGNGPHAGTYKLPASRSMCMRFKEQERHRGLQGFRRERSEEDRRGRDQHHKS